MDWIEARMGLRLTPFSQKRIPEAVLIDGPDSLLVAAARFSSVLSGLPQGDAPSDPTAAEALAWQRLAAFIERLPKATTE